MWGRYLSLIPPSSLALQARWKCKLSRPVRNITWLSVTNWVILTLSKLDFIIPLFYSAFRYNRLSLLQNHYLTVSDLLCDFEHSPNIFYYPAFLFRFPLAQFCPLYNKTHIYIWQLTRNCSMFDRNIQLFEILSTSDFWWFSVRHWWVSVTLHWISVKHSRLPWQFAVLSMSVVMFDRTVCVFDRISFRFDRTAQKC